MAASRIAVAALALSLLPAAAADAATVSTRTSPPRFAGSPPTSVLLFKAATGERNDVKVAYRTLPGGGQEVTVEDATAMNAGEGCRLADPAQSRRVVCSLSLGSNPGEETLVRLGDRDDSLEVSGAPANPRPLRVSDGSGNDRVLGSDGDDVLVNEAGNDVLDGREGDDALGGGVGRDRLLGGSGADLVSYRGRRRSVRVDLRGDADDGARGERDRVGRDVEFISGGNGRDVLVGSGAANEIFGRGGSDRIRGGGGEDEVFGGGGRDRLDPGKGEDIADGGSGTDLLLTRDRRRDVVVCGGQRRDRVIGDRLDDIEGCSRLSLR